LALSLWRELELARFWGGRLPSRKGTRWDRVLLLLATYRLLAPGSEWRLHREWFEAAPPANPNASTPAVSSPNANNPGAPAAGANSFTEGQAKSRIEGAGYSKLYILQFEGA